ncbi:MAG TPA: GNAT family N-acetyltransferase [Ktedonobacterales bacterium]|nr:GNAT family N-acetyltransferase [Ktedonobacterales bacterium]
MDHPHVAYTLTPFTVGSPALDDAVRLYVEQWPEPWEQIHAFITYYAGFPAFQGRIARLTDGTAIGMGFGVRSLPEDWWHRQVAVQVGATHPALQDAWVLVELVVSAAYCGQGIGSALMETLLVAQPCARALLSTEVENTGARRLYERHGWTYLHPGFVFAPGTPAFVVMQREVATG